MEEIKQEEIQTQEIGKREEDAANAKAKEGFWKGFFSASLLFLGILALALGIVISSKVKQIKTEPSQEEQQTLTTQSREVHDKLALLENYIRAYYLNEIDEEQLEDYLYYGLVAGIGDPYAAYFNEKETQDLWDSRTGRYCGIGAVFSQNLTTGVITVAQVYEGFPAHEAGILPEDILYKVEEEEVTGQDITSITPKIKGEEDTEVTITVLRGEEELEFTMKRKKVEVPTIESEMLEGNVGYIRILEFDSVTDAQFSEAMAGLQKDGMKSLVIDLRDNGGGDVTAVCNIADELLPEGLIMYTEYANGEREDRTSDAACLELPMAVLINGNSASASEILAGALKDYEAAIIVGTQSFGKGIVQSVIDLKDGTALKLTTAKYYTPNGNNIHGIGIAPDVEIDLPEELKTKVELTLEEDVQLQKAIEVLQQ